jgi:hypothetical protein
MEKSRIKVNNESSARGTTGYQKRRYTMRPGSVAHGEKRKDAIFDGKLGFLVDVGALVVVVGGNLKI